MIKISESNSKQINVFITQACDAGNKGDQGIEKSEIAFIRRLYPNAGISVATWWSNDLLRRVQPDISVYSPLIDLNLRGKDIPLYFYPFFMVFQFILSMVSALALQAGLRPIYRPDYIKALKDSDVVMSSGHQPFVEGSPYRPRTLWSFSANLLVLFWGFADVLIAKKIFRTRVASFPQSMGPFNTFIGRFFARFIFGNMDAVFVRETISRETLTKLGIKTPIYLAIDMAFFFKPNCNQKSALNHPSIGVSPCFVAGIKNAEKANYVDVLSKTLIQFQQKYNASIVFLPSQTTQGKAMAASGREDDYSASKIVESRMIELGGDSSKTKTVFTESVDDFALFLHQLDMLVATRMHPSIFAAAEAVPFVEVIYEHKQVGLLENLSLQQVGISVNGLSVEKLSNKMDYVWANRIQIKRHLEEKISFLRSRDQPILERLIKALVSKN